MASGARNGNDALRSRERDHHVERSNDRTYDRRVQTTPKSHSWLIVASGAVVPIGLGGAAVAATYLSNHEKVAIAAWVAVAVVGTAAVISAAAVSHQRTVSVDRHLEGNTQRRRMGNLSRA